MKKYYLCKVWLVSVIVFGLSYSNSVLSSEKYHFVKAEVVTGVNSFLGSPVVDLGVVLGVPLGVFHFSELGEYNPDGEVKVLSPETKTNAVLATIIDPAIFKVLGLDPGQIDESLVNIPLNSVKTLFNGDGVSRLKPKPSAVSLPDEISVSSASKPVTLKQWLSASGVAKIYCHGSEFSYVSLELKKLLPDRVYTVWVGSVKKGNLQGFDLGPFGGSPSSFTTDLSGNAIFNRYVNYCPVIPFDSATKQVLRFVVALHSDHMIYGSVPSLLGRGLLGGTVSHNHLEFNFVGSKL